MKRLEASYDNQSLQRGHDNDYIYKHIHHIINYLVSVNLIPAAAVVGRLTLGNMTRTGLNFSYQELFEIRDEVWMAVYNYGVPDPDEVMKILYNACMFAGLTGCFEFNNAGVEVFSQTIQSLPKSTQCMVMGSEINRSYVLEHSVAA